MDKSVDEFYNMRIEMKRNWRMSFYCNSMMKNKNLGHLLVNKKKATTTMTMATKTTTSAGQGYSLWHRNMLYFAFHKFKLSCVCLSLSLNASDC